ncbi:MAG: hypothetical protein NTW87_28425 [Planctomycetota bacterium]|nr:hypothetical protein [Planctomycetota bacterium]
MSSGVAEPEVVPPPATDVPPPEGVSGTGGAPVSGPGSSKAVGLRSSLLGVLSAVADFLLRPPSYTSPITTTISRKRVKSPHLNSRKTFAAPLPMDVERPILAV